MLVKSLTECLTWRKLFTSLNLSVLSREVRINIAPMSLCCGEDSNMIYRVSDVFVFIGLTTAWAPLIQNHVP